MERSKLGIVIPAYNESKNIKNIIESIKPYGIPIVVDDGSLDDTAEISRNSGAIVCNHKNNLGYDQALNSGLNAVDELGLDYAITMDADGEHAAKDIEKIKELLLTSDIVVGIREKKARISEYLFGLYTNRTYGIKDPLCGMKGYKMLSYKNISNKNSYKSIGTELLLKGLDAGLRVEQIRLTHYAKRKGKPKLGGFIKSNILIFTSLFRAINRYF
tara:strand:- start:2181 stop:2828 length:648 start_codon:yes stop_codon:yes gene_type:complete